MSVSLKLTPMVWLPNRTINVNFGKITALIPRPVGSVCNRLGARPGRFGLQPNRILHGNLESSKALFSPVGWVERR